LFTQLWLCLGGLQSLVDLYRGRDSVFLSLQDDHQLMLQEDVKHRAVD
jgi:hypothetical protein